MYKIACGNTCGVENACVIEFDDNSQLELSAKKLVSDYLKKAWRNVVIVMAEP